MTVPIWNRRRFLQGGLAVAGVGLAAGCGMLPPFGSQPAAKVPRIGYLAAGLPGEPTGAAFLDGMRELGYVEGQNVTIEWRFAEGNVGRLPQLAVELIGLPVDLILASGPDATVAARKVSTTLPIVMCFGGDPIELGLIASLAHPGGNVTGLAALTAELNAKRLQLFADALPGLSRVAVLWDANASPSGKTRLEDAARSLTLRLEMADVRGPSDLDGAFREAVARRAEGLFVADTPLITALRRRVAQLATSSRLPASGGGGEARDFAEAGVLMTYGARFPTIYRRAATYVDKIVKGARPADLPVEQPTTFDFLINLKTARALGLAIPQSVLAQATELIQ